MKIRSVLRMAESAVWGWMRTEPSHRTGRPSTDAVVTRKRAAGRAPVNEFHSTPAWRNTSIGAMAVEENISSRNTTVTSITCASPKVCWRNHLYTMAYLPSCFKPSSGLLSKHRQQLVLNAEAPGNQKLRPGSREHSRCRFEIE